jgi:hypothetical protein
LKNKSKKKLNRSQVEKKIIESIVIDGEDENKNHNDKMIIDEESKILKKGKKRKIRELSNSPEISRLSTTKDFRMDTLQQNERDEPSDKEVVEIDERAIYGQINSIQVANISSESFQKNFSDMLNQLPEIDNEDRREKSNFLRKFITLFKKLRDDQDKNNIFCEFLSRKVEEEVEELQTAFEFEFIKSKAEGIYSNLSKLIIKYTSTLSENSINDVSNCSQILVENASDDLKDKLKGIIIKISSYIAACNEIK